VENLDPGLTSRPGRRRDLFGKVAAPPARDGGRRQGGTCPRITTTPAGCLLAPPAVDRCPFPQGASMIAVSVIPGAVHDPTAGPVHRSHEPMGTGYAVVAAWHPLTSGHL